MNICDTFFNILLFASSHSVEDMTCFLRTKKKEKPAQISHHSFPLWQREGFEKSNRASGLEIKILTFLLKTRTPLTWFAWNLFGLFFFFLQVGPAAFGRKRPLQFEHPRVVPRTLEGHGRVNQRSAGFKLPTAQWPSFFFFFFTGDMFFRPTLCSRRWLMRPEINIINRITRSVMYNLIKACECF